MAGQIFAPDGTLIVKFKGNQTNRPTVPNGAGAMVAAADRYNYGNLPEVLLANSLFIEDPARPDEPAWPRTKPPAVRLAPTRGEWQYPTPCIDPFTFHHIIPWNTLRECWSCLAFERNYDVLKALMGAFGITGAATKVTHMKKSALTSDERDEIHQHLCWVKWNVVEGPLNTLRIDDAENDFDDFQYGMTMSQQTQLADVKNLFGAMDSFIDRSRKFKKTTFDARRAGKPITPTSSGILLDMLNAMRGYDKPTATHIPFHWEMWQPVTVGGMTGTWAWAPQPTWKRASKNRSPSVLHDEIASFGNRFDPGHAHSWWTG